MSGGSERKVMQMKRGGGRIKFDLCGVWSTWRSHIKYTWSIYWHSVFTETKGGDGAEEEEEKEKRRLGQRGRKVDGKGGEGPLCVSFQESFYSVTSNADLQHHPTPKAPSRRSVQAAPPSSSSVLCIAKWTVIGYSFMRLISGLTTLPPLHPHRKRPFLLPLRSKHICAYVVNMPDGRYQVVEARLWTLKAFNLKPGLN